MAWRELEEIASSCTARCGGAPRRSRQPAPRRRCRPTFPFPGVDPSARRRRRGERERWAHRGTAACAPIAPWPSRAPRRRAGPMPSPARTRPSRCATTATARRCATSPAGGARARRRARPSASAPARFANHVDRAPEIASVGGAVTRAARSTCLRRSRDRQDARARGDAARHPAGAATTSSSSTAAASPRTTCCTRCSRSSTSRRTAVRDPRHRPPPASRARRSVAIEDVALAADELKHLLDGAPRCRFIFTSRERVLWDGAGDQGRRMEPEFAPALAEQELGHALDDDEHAAAIEIAASLSATRCGCARRSARRATRAPRWRRCGRSSRRPPVLQDRLVSLSDLGGAGRALAGRVRRGLGRRRAPARRRLTSRMRCRRWSTSSSATTSRSRTAATGCSACSRTRCRCRTTCPTRPAAPPRTSRAGWRARRRPDAALADMPAVLALIERSFLEGRSVEAIRLGRAAEGYLSQRQRWAAWGLVLAIVLACARDLERRRHRGLGAQPARRALARARPHDRGAAAVRAGARGPRAARATSAGGRSRAGTCARSSTSRRRCRALSHSSLGSCRDVVLVIGASWSPVTRERRRHDRGARRWPAGWSDHGHHRRQRQADTVSGGITCARGLRPQAERVRRDTDRDGREGIAVRRLHRCVLGKATRAPEWAPALGHGAVREGRRSHETGTHRRPRGRSRLASAAARRIAG